MKLTRIRAYEGRNIFSHYPVVAMLVDLGRYDGKKTSELDGFSEILLEALPGLKTHHCSSSRPGGFVRRLEEGTFLGHVIEHVALELQSMAGWNVIYGKTRQADEQAATGRRPDVARHLEAIRKVEEETGLGPSTAALRAEAERLGIPVCRLGRGSLLVLGHGCRQRRLWATITSRTSCVAADLAGDKLLTKEVLEKAGIPVPRGLVVRSKREAVRALETLGPPVVVKPVQGNQGRGVSLNVTKPAEARAAFVAAAAVHGREVLVEEHVPGRHYRFLVVGDHLAAAAERRPAEVVGDGRLTVRELVAEVNRDPLRGEGHERPLTRIRIDPVAELLLARQGLDPDSVPEAGRRVVLRENGNLSTGGTAADVTGRVHPANARLAVRAARVVGLDVAGVDLVAEDVGVPLTRTGGAVVEVNAAPGLRMHLHPSEGSPRNVARPILAHLFSDSPAESSCPWLRRGPWGARPGRIPVVAVTGTNGKTTVSRLIAHILARSGLTVGLATTDGAWVGEECIMQGDCAGPRTARAILFDPAVQAAVLETARGGIIREGLAFDSCDVGLVTNISPDHEGQDGMDRLEDIAFVKALVVETVARDGHAVLNADDPFVHGMAGRARGGVVFFSRNPGNVVVRKHLLEGGRAVYVSGGTIVAEEQGGQERVATLGEVPLTLGGLLPFHVENAVAAVAAAWSLGVPLTAVRRALGSFGRAGQGYAANPGRFHLFQWGPKGRVTVVLDYGHNRAAYAETLSAARKLCRGELHAVIGAPGDRLDEHILEMGRQAALAAQRVVIKEDADARGRARGEVASLFLRGVLDTGYPESRVDIVLDERAALEQALSLARPGDWVLVFFEKLPHLVECLTARGARPLTPSRLLRRTTPAGERRPVPPAEKRVRSDPAATTATSPAGQ